jgi:hypothetical protein
MMGHFHFTTMIAFGQIYWFQPGSPGGATFIPFRSRYPAFWIRHIISYLINNFNFASLGSAVLA